MHHTQTIPTHPAATHETGTHPTVTHPTVTHPTVTHPTVTHPTVTHPTVTHPTVTHPTVTHPTATHPTATHPTATQPTTTPPTGERPAGTAATPATSTTTSTATTTTAGGVTTSGTTTGVLPGSTTNPPGTGGLGPRPGTTVRFGAEIPPRTTTTLPFTGAALLGVGLAGLVLTALGLLARVAGGRVEPLAPRTAELREVVAAVASDAAAPAPRALERTAATHPAEAIVYPVIAPARWQVTGRRSYTPGEAAREVLIFDLVEATPGVAPRPPAAAV